MNLVNDFKSTVYKFMFEFYFENMPNVALNNLKVNNFDRFINYSSKFQASTLKKTLTCAKINFSAGKMQEKDNKMTVFVSGVKKFGKITYHCANFKQKMQIKTE